MNGMMAFCAVYSLGMTAYGCYQELCYLQGMTPVTEIGGQSVADTATAGTPYEIGRAGEDLAGIDQNAKTSIEINGRIAKTVINAGWNIHTLW